MKHVVLKQKEECKPNFKAVQPTPTIFPKSTQTQLQLNKP